MAGLWPRENVGVEKATGEIVFFAESDCVYDESYLQKAVERLNSEPEAGAVRSPEPR